MILAGDVGGTNTRLRLFSLEGGERLVGGPEGTVPSRSSAGLGEIVSRFLAQSGGVRIGTAAFGVAGPVREGRVEATNLPWIVDAREIAATVGIPRILLLNDLEANAWGISLLEPKDIWTMNPETPPSRGNAAILAAGTGLGEAGLYWDGSRHIPYSTEGGHSSFAPCSEREVRLLSHLMARFDHVSWERVLSGPGLSELYLFLRDREGMVPSGEDVMASPDPSAAITERALSGSCPLCREALHMFVDLYGSEAGNLALKHLALAGVYLGGGIAPKILTALQQPRFRERFVGKGRMRSLLSTIPVHVILNDKTALLGAASFAARHA
jgi:glucokinase